MNPRNDIIPLTLTGDLRQGGWRLTGEMRGDTDALGEGRNVRAAGRSLSGFIDAAPREYFNGHITGNPDFSFDRYQSSATFTAATADAFLAGLDVQDLSFAVAGSPANVHERTSWRFSTIVQHILTQHCNIVYDADSSDGSPDGIVTTLDLDTTNSTLFNVAGDFFIVNHSTNLWQTLQNIGGGEEGGGEFYRIWCTRRNVIRYQPAPPFISPAPTARGNLNKTNLRGQVGVRYNNSQPGQKVGQVQIVAGIRPTAIYSAKYPANPATGRILQKKSGIWAQSQARANNIAERLYKWLTRPYTLTVEVDAGLALFGDDGRGLDLGDRVTLTYNGPAEDTATGGGVHLNLSAQSFYVYAAQVSFDPERRTATAYLTLEYDNA